MFKCIVLCLLLLASCVPEEATDRKLRFEDLDSEAKEGTEKSRRATSFPQRSANGQKEGAFLGVGALDIRHGDRFYIANMVTSIFGSDAESTARDLIRNKSSLFGGICDRYRDSGCDAKDSNTVFSYSNTARAGMMTKVCETLVRRNGSLDFSLRRNGLTRTAEITADNINRQYRLFYPKRKAPEAFVNKLMEASTVIDRTDDRWRVVTLAICLSPGWLIP